MRSTTFLRKLPFRSACVFIFLVFICSHGNAQEEYPEPQSRLKVIVPDSVNFGEQFTITVAYEVDDDNQARIQFYEPGHQLKSILTHFFQLGLIFDEKIQNIYGVRPEGENIDYTQYLIYKARVQPLKPGLIEIPALDWTMQQISLISDLENADRKLINQQSAPVSITVTDTHNRYTDKYSPPTLGDLFVSDSISPGPYKVGQHINYTIKLSGMSVGLLTALPVDHKDISILPDYVSYEDSLMQNGTIGFSKVFHLSIIPRHEGEIHLGGIFKWPHLDSLGTAQQVSVNTTIQVNKESDHTHLPSHIGTIFLLDLSESMQIEDYLPSRLHKGFELVEAYQKQFAKGRLVGFSESSVDLRYLPLNDSLYNYVKRGTAIGNVIFLGSQTFSHEEKIKAIILVGDGESTAGNLSVTDALEFAKSRGIKIYSIGIGHSGRVPYGKDDSGLPQYVENTFEDSALKKASSFTGGKYYHVDDYPSLDRLMKTISNDMKK